MLDYSCNETVVVGNGNKLQISCVSCASLTDGKNCLRLENILCVAEIKKNMVSVSRLSQGNNVLLEFHDVCYFVRAKDMVEFC